MGPRLLPEPMLTLIKVVPWHPPKTNFTGSDQDIDLYNEFEYAFVKLFHISQRRMN